MIWIFFKDSSEESSHKFNVVYQKLKTYRNCLKTKNCNCDCWKCSKNNCIGYDDDNDENLLTEYACTDNQKSSTSNDYRLPKKYEKLPVN